jgi:hypothetical protein
MGNKSGKGSKVETAVIMAGVADSGKTTLLYQMKLGELVTTEPTLGFNCNTIDHRKFHFTIYGTLSFDEEQIFNLF